MRLPVVSFCTSLFEGLSESIGGHCVAIGRGCLGDGQSRRSSSHWSFWVLNSRDSAVSKILVGCFTQRITHTHISSMGRMPKISVFACMIQAWNTTTCIYVIDDLCLKIDWVHKILGLRHSWPTCLMKHSPKRRGFPKTPPLNGTVLGPSENRLGWSLCCPFGLETSAIFNVPRAAAWCNVAVGIDKPKNFPFNKS